MLLDSSLHHEDYGRYSFICYHPLYFLEAHGNKIIVYDKKNNIIDSYR